MTPRKTADIRRSLLAKGFEQEQTHHEMFWLCKEGRRTSVRTRLSHGAKEYGEPLLGAMARQVKLSRADFEDLLDCPLSREEYLQRLVEAGHVA